MILMMEKSISNFFARSGILTPRDLKQLKARKRRRKLDFKILAEFSRHARRAAFNIIHLKATKAAGLISTVASDNKLQL